jgi:hypothetical protein
MPVGIEDRQSGAPDPEKEPKRNGYVIGVNPIKGSSCHPTFSLNLGLLTGTAMP